MVNNQHELKKLIYQKTKTITDEILFASRTYMDFLYTILEGVTKRFQKNLKIVFEDEDENMTARTNSECIYINRNYYMVKGLDRKEKSNFYIGTLLHEAAHILFSDFKLMKACNETLIKDNRLFPLPEESDALTELSNWLTANNGGLLLAEPINNLDNTIEDGYVDNKIMQLIPGYGRCRAFVRSIMKKDIPTYEELKAKKTEAFAIMQMLVFRYGKFGDATFEQESLKDDLVAKFFEIKPLIDKALNTNDSLSRRRIINEVFVHLFSLLQFPQNHQNQNSSSDSGDSNNSNGQNDGDPANNSSSSASDNGQEQTDPNGTPDNQSSVDPASIMQALQNAMQNLPKELKENSDHQNNQPLSSSEIESVMPSGDAPISENAEPISIPEALMQNAAKEEVEKQQESEIAKKLAEATKEIAHDKGIHYGVESLSNRIKMSDVNRALFESEHKELEAIAKRLVKNLKKEIKDRQLGDKLNGMYMGKKIDSHALYRQDKKIFAKDILPEDIPNMEISLLVDLSGSMLGKSLDAARKTAYITYSFCKMLHIPISITGHNTSGKTVNIYSFADARCIDEKDGQRIYAMKAGGSNRDGYAVRYCLKKLEKSTASTRFMMIISDGLPNHRNYGRSEGRADLQDAVATYKKKGIRTIVAGIAADAPYVKEIYTKGISERKSAVFLDLSDLQRLPKTFVNIIKKELS